MSEEQNAAPAETAPAPEAQPLTAAEAIEWLREDGDADPEGTARLNYPELFQTDDETAVAPTETAPPAEPSRTTPLGWDELGYTGDAGMLGLIVAVLESAEGRYIRQTEPHVSDFDLNYMGLTPKLNDERIQALLPYVIERRPGAEVMFNKARELGIVAGGFADLLPVDRASFELAARLIPAIADVVDTINAEIVARNPSPAPAVAVRPVDIEDTIFEQTDGIGELDPVRAAAQAKADEAAAAHAAGKKPAKKKRSIADAAD